MTNLAHRFEEIIDLPIDAAHDDNNLWNNINLAQKFTLSKLVQFGYELADIRKTEFGCIAIADCYGHRIAISEDGDFYN